jgi:predicted transcriptional regulator YdeE
MGSKTEKNPEPRIVTIPEPMQAAGLIMKTGIKSVYRDVTKILKNYMDLKSRHGMPGRKDPWEYVSLSRNFEDLRTWDYLTGHVVANPEGVPDVFIRFEIPPGNYAVFQVRPRHKFMLGPAIGNIKRYIYTKWLPDSGYEFAGHEFEYNDESMFRESPNFVDLYVAVTKKGA